MKKPELLAPAGNMECLIAAIEAGCDAIYLGGKTFGARNYAGNFSNDEIIEAIQYAHLYGVKIYVTVNTLIYESEVDSFIKYVDFLHKNNVDAIIIQDIGMLDLVRQMFPYLEVHASTQMHIHNIEGVKFLEKLGVKRVVLARELNINEISKIKKNTNIELEVFVHGALCISYSGQCLMSAMIGGRSGNRGMCAQCCRQAYYLENMTGKKVTEKSYLLSTKDLNSLLYIDKLIDNNVDSIKIEGRMKRKEYVYKVVSLYRKAIDQYINEKQIKIDETEIYELKKLFNREFTKGFLNDVSNCDLINSKRPNHMGIEIGKVIGSSKNRIVIELYEELNCQDGIRILGKDDVGFTVTNMYKDNEKIKGAYRGDKIEIPLKDKIELNSKIVKTTDYKQLNEINDKIKKRLRRVKITAKIIAKTGEPFLLILKDDKNEVTVRGNVVEKALKQPITRQHLEKNIDRLEDTVYRLEKIEYEIDEFIFIPVSNLNFVRREAVRKLNEKRNYQLKYLKNQYKKDVVEYNDQKGYNLLIDTEEQYNKLKDSYLEIYVENEKLYEKLKKDPKIIYKMPRVVNHYKRKYENVLIGELGGIYCAKGYSDFSFNVVNSYAIAFLHNCGIKRVTLSYELTDHQIEIMIKNYQKRYHREPNLEKIIYSYPEVMISKYLLLKNYNQKKEGYLVDKYNNHFKIKEKDHYTVIYHSALKEDTHLERYFEMGIKRLRVHSEV